jgi:hypothetical protein
MQKKKNKTWQEINHEDEMPFGEHPHSNPSLGPALMGNPAFGDSSTSSNPFLGHSSI